MYVGYCRVVAIDIDISVSVEYQQTDTNTSDRVCSALNKVSIICNSRGTVNSTDMARPLGHNHFEMAEARVTPEDAG